LSTEKRTVESIQAPAPTPVSTPLSMREVAGLLVKHYGLHEGSYDLMIEFKIGVGTVGADSDDEKSPGAIIGLSRVGLVLSKKAGITTVDASTVNPPRKKTKQIKASGSR